MIDINYLKKNNLLLFECISGSKAYGLETPESDTDIKGVFVLPKEMYYGLDYIPQVNNESHDMVYYEIKRYIELLAKNNPNLLEMLFVAHMKNIYALFYDKTENLGFNGIVKNADSMDVTTSKIPKGHTQQAIISVNVDGYSRYCKAYSEYWDWVEKRNDERYATTLSHGKKYDAKNMMHTFRLLGIAEEIAKTGTFSTRRPNREELLTIKSGKFEYEELIIKANKMIEDIKNLFVQSHLQETVDIRKANEVLFEIRDTFYNRYKCGQMPGCLTGT